MPETMSSEQRYYDALKRIAAYQSPGRLRKEGPGGLGLSYEDALEMAYENVIEEAKAAIKGKRRPK